MHYLVLGAEGPRREPHCSDAAKMLNVSKRSVASAAEVLGEGEADLIHAVEQAKLKVSAAADQSGDPEEAAHREWLKRRMEAETKKVAFIPTRLETRPRRKRP